MDVRTLLEDSVRLPPGPPGDDPVRGLAVDSRRVEPGFVFFARPGRRTDGARYVGAALAAGAAAAVAPAGAAPPAPRLVEVGDVRRAAGAAADRFHGRPSSRLDVVGVTGTDGKTTVTHCIAQASGAITPERGGAPCAVVGTLGAGVPGALGGAALTTPDVLDVHRVLAGLHDAGMRRAAVEVSSHGLDQGRVEGVRFRAACLTNFARDHLDYHGSEAAYAAAKRRLFAWPGLEAAVVNADDRLGRALLEEGAGAARVLSYAMDDRGAAVHGRLAPSGAQGRLRIEVRYGGRSATLESALAGRFNAYNLLAALGVLLALEVPLESAVEGLAGAAPPPGRLQPVRLDGAPAGLPAVFVDYAHTPHALAAALGAVRALARGGGGVRVVFGCGGERDEGKRRLMGAVAAGAADRLFVTSDNPRGEDPLAIIDEIVAGAGEARVEVRPDRREAIHAAIADAAPEDVVLVAGKGHEAWQEIGGERRPFDDAAVAREALARRAEGGGR